LDDGKGATGTPLPNYSKLIEFLWTSGKYRSNIQLEALSLWYFYSNKVNNNFKHMKHFFC
jgi:hypothetical protein